MGKGYGPMKIATKGTKGPPEGTKGTPARVFCKLSLCYVLHIL